MKITNLVKQYLDNRNWKYIEKDFGFLLPVEVEGYRLITAFHCLEESEQLIFYSHFPITIPKKKINPLALLITDFNFEITIGNFILNRQKGDIRYKTSIELSTTSLTKEILDNLVDANFAISVNYYPKILAFLAPKDNQNKDS
jgi:hypothetical protein